MEFEALDLLEWIVEQVENFDNGSLDSFLNITDTDPVRFTTEVVNKQTEAKVNKDYLFNKILLAPVGR